MTRVLFISEGLDRPEAHTIAGLQQAGLRMQAMLSPSDPFASFLRDHDVEIIPLVLRNRLDLNAIRAIRATIKTGGCSVVHALRNNRPVANALFAVRGLPVKLVCYRGTIGNLHRLDPGSRLTYLNGRLDGIVCVSNSVRSYLQSQGVPPARLQTIYKGHDPAWYQQAGNVDLPSLGVPAGSLVVGCAANMRPQKGAHMLLYALDHLDPALCVHLLLIGEVRDPKLRDLLKDPRYRERVTATGFRKDAQALLGACDIAAMPSLLREGLPRAIIEAMCQSLPCVVTRVGGMPELVEHEGNGFVVEPGDSAALADCIRKLATDPGLRARFGARSLERVREQFNIANTIAETRALYERLLS